MVSLDEYRDDSCFRFPLTLMVRGNVSFSRSFRSSKRVVKQKPSANLAVKQPRVPLCRTVWHLKVAVLKVGPTVRSPRCVRNVIRVFRYRRLCETNA